MNPRTLEEAMKAMDEAEAREAVLFELRDHIWNLLSESHKMVRLAREQFNEFTARHREEKR